MMEWIAVGKNSDGGSLLEKQAVWERLMWPDIHHFAPASDLHDAGSCDQSFSAQAAAN
jgi:hypothetical protein